MPILQMGEVVVVVVAAAPVANLSDHCLVRHSHATTKLDPGKGGRRDFFLSPGTVLPLFQMQHGERCSYGRNRRRA